MILRENLGGEGGGGKRRRKERKGDNRGGEGGGRREEKEGEVAGRFWFRFLQGPGQQGNFLSCLSRGLVQQLACLVPY